MYHREFVNAVSRIASRSTVAPLELAETSGVYSLKLKTSSLFVVNHIRSDGKEQESVSSLVNLRGRWRVFLFAKSEIRVICSASVSVHHKTLEDELLDKLQLRLKCVGNILTAGNTSLWDTMKQGIEQGKKPSWCFEDHRVPIYYKEGDAWYHIGTLIGLFDTFRVTSFGENDMKDTSGIIYKMIFATSMGSIYAVCTSNMIKTGTVTEMKPVPLEEHDKKQKVISGTLSFEMEWTNDDYKDNLMCMSTILFRNEIAEDDDFTIYEQRGKLFKRSASRILKVADYYVPLFVRCDVKYKGRKKFEHEQYLSDRVMPLLIQSVKNKASYECRYGDNTIYVKIHPFMNIFSKQNQASNEPHYVQEYRSPTKGTSCFRLLLGVLGLSQLGVSAPMITEDNTNAIINLCTAAGEGLSDEGFGYKLVPNFVPFQCSVNPATQVLSTVSSFSQFDAELPLPTFSTFIPNGTTSIVFDSRGGHYENKNDVCEAFKYATGHVCIQRVKTMEELKDKFESSFTYTLRVATGIGAQQYDVYVQNEIYSVIAAEPHPSIPVEFTPAAAAYEINVAGIPGMNEAVFLGEKMFNASKQLENSTARVELFNSTLMLEGMDIDKNTLMKFTDAVIEGRKLVNESTIALQQFKQAPVYNAVTFDSLAQTETRVDEVMNKVIAEYQPRLPMLVNPFKNSRSSYPELIAKGFADLKLNDDNSIEIMRVFGDKYKLDSVVGISPARVGFSQKDLSSLVERINNDLQKIQSDLNTIDTGTVARVKLQFALFKLDVIYAQCNGIFNAKGGGYDEIVSVSEQYNATVAQTNGMLKTVNIIFADMIDYTKARGVTAAIGNACEILSPGTDIAQLTIESASRLLSDKRDAFIIKNSAYVNIVINDIDRDNIPIRELADVKAKLDNVSRDVAIDVELVIRSSSDYNVEIKNTAYSPSSEAYVCTWIQNIYSSHRELSSSRWFDGYDITKSISSYELDKVNVADMPLSTFTWMHTEYLPDLRSKLSLAKLEMTDDKRMLQEILIDSLRIASGRCANLATDTKNLESQRFYELMAESFSNELIREEANSYYARGNSEIYSLLDETFSSIAQMYNGTQHLSDKINGTEIMESPRNIEILEAMESTIDDPDFKKARTDVKADGTNPYVAKLYRKFYEITEMENQKVANECRNTIRQITTKLINREMPTEEGMKQNAETSKACEAKLNKILQNVKTVLQAQRGSFYEIFEFAGANYESYLKTPSMAVYNYLRFVDEGKPGSRPINYVMTMATLGALFMGVSGTIAAFPTAAAIITISHETLANLLFTIDQSKTQYSLLRDFAGLLGPAVLSGTLGFVTGGPLAAASGFFSGLFGGAVSPAPATVTNTILPAASMASMLLSKKAYNFAYAKQRQKEIQQQMQQTERMATSPMNIIPDFMGGAMQMIGDPRYSGLLASGFQYAFQNYWGPSPTHILTAGWITLNISYSLYSYIAYSDSWGPGTKLLETLKDAMRKGHQLIDPMFDYASQITGQKRSGTRRIPTEKERKTPVSIGSTAADAPYMGNIAINPDYRPDLAPLEPLVSSQREIHLTLERFMRQSFSEFERIQDKICQTTLGKPLKVPTLESYKCLDRVEDGQKYCFNNDHAVHKIKAAKKGEVYTVMTCEFHALELRANFDYIETFANITESFGEGVRHDFRFLRL